MGCSDSRTIEGKINEVCKNNYMPIYLINKAGKSVCKITYLINYSVARGTGFFMKINHNNNSFKYLITCFHVVPKELIDKEINLEIQETPKKKKIKIVFDLKNRDIKFFEDPLDITAIQIKDEDSDIINNWDFLICDENYINGYDIYMKSDVFVMGYPKGDILEHGSGEIVDIDKDNYEFKHNSPTDIGFSGSPIILFNSLVVGIHKKGIISEKLNLGTFIGVIIKELIPNNINSRKKSKKKSKKNSKKRFFNKKENDKSSKSEDESNSKENKFISGIKIVKKRDEEGKEGEGEGEGENTKVSEIDEEDQSRSEEDILSKKGRKIIKKDKKEENKEGKSESKNKVIKYEDKKEESKSKKER